ncbi:MAG: hypothetical protein LIO71_04275 [Ruminococcus sp.]|nr:hypothetical protein [Ruminococcus sp.]MCC8174450.1 hypothetical protein [Odoribacter sp.]
MFESISERIQWLIEKHSDGNLTNFAKTVSINRTTLQAIVAKRSSNPTCDVINKIAESHTPKVNLYWLMQGKGEIYLENNEQANLNIQGSNNHYNEGDYNICGDNVTSNSNNNSTPQDEKDLAMQLPLLTKMLDRISDRDKRAADLEKRIQELEKKVEDRDATIYSLKDQILDLKMQLIQQK